MKYGGADLVRAGLSGVLLQAAVRAQDRGLRVQVVVTTGQARAAGDVDRAGLRRARIPPCCAGVVQKLTLSGNSCSATRFRPPDLLRGVSILKTA